MGPADGLVAVDGLDQQLVGGLNLGRAGQLPRYGVSVSNVTALKQAGAAPINVGKFTTTGESKQDITGRAVGPIKTPDERPFEEYVRKALIDEVQVAGAYSESAPVVLSGNLDRIDFSSTEGKWTLAMTVKSTNGRSPTVANDYSYDTSFVAEKACALTAQAFGPAVQTLIGKLVYHQEFAGLVK
ncbi:MAG TPA: hypothetical protein VKH83_03785 [Methylomirabilota bacterium]|nr:hypothetical protein [Methylomirabilota bacterium]